MRWTKIQPHSESRRKNPPKNMKKCPTCGHEGVGKFCGKCGGALPGLQLQSAILACPSCGKSLAPNARFCGGCGSNLVAAASPPLEGAGRAPIRVAARGNVELLRGAKLIWSLEPQVIAQRLAEDKMASLTGAKGIIIREGTRALIFADGKLLGEFTEGEYDFRDALSGAAGVPGAGAQTVRVGGLMGSLRGMAEWTGRLLLGERVSAEEARRRADQKEAEKAARGLVLEQPESHGLVDNFLSAVQAKKAIAVVLARSDDFHLVFSYKGVKSADLKTDVGVDLLMRVRDLTDFYRDFLMDTHVLTTKGLSDRLGPILDLEVAEAVRGVRVEELEQNRSLLESLETRLNRELDRTMPSVKVSRVFKLTAKREEIERLNQLREKLYLSEKELSVLQAQNEFSNRLRLEETQQQLKDAKSDVELEQQMRAINKDKLLGEEQFAQWLERVKLDRDLASARTQDERESVLHELRKKDFLRDEDIQLLQGQSELKVGHTLGMMEMRQELESRRLRLEMDSELGLKELDLELERQRRQLLADAEFTELTGRTEQLRLEQDLKQRGMTSTYEDQRRGAERGHRREDVDLDQLEQLKQLEVAQKAQALAQTQAQQQHERDLAELREVKRAEKELLEADAQRWANLSVEQIMAANPNLTPEAARALSERGSSAKAEEFAQKQTAMAKESKDEFKEMMRLQMEAQERMMRTMMESNATIAGAQVRQKDVEVDRAHSAADKSEERNGRVVSSTVGAFAGKPGSPAPKHRHCSKCGVQLALDASFCTECGNKD